MSNTRFKEILGFDRADTASLYRVLRGEIKIFMGIHSINYRTHPGDTDWRGMIDWVLGHQHTRRAQRLRRARGLEDVLQLRRAAHFLCLDCARTLYTPPGVLGRTSEDSSEVEVPPSPTTSSTATTDGRTIRIGLFDPDMHQGLEVAGGGIIVSYFVILGGEPVQSFPRLVTACKKHLPAGRTLSELRGWTGLPGEDVVLSDSGEIQAWLSATSDVQPPRVIAILNNLRPPSPIVVSTCFPPSPI